MFDPESRVKFMLEGLANIILRPDMSGLLTEYQKMKIEKYEIPISACSSLIDDEMYSKYVRRDSGEEKSKVEAHMEEAARRFDEAKAAKEKGQPQKRRRTFPATRFHKIEAIRERCSVDRFCWVRVDTDGAFEHDGLRYRIADDEPRYAARKTKDGEDVYDMDRVLCASCSGGSTLFFDMNIEPVEKIILQN